MSQSPTFLPAQPFVETPAVSSTGALLDRDYPQQPSPPLLRSADNHVAAIASYRNEFEAMSITAGLARMYQISTRRRVLLVCGKHARACLLSGTLGNTTHDESIRNKSHSVAGRGCCYHEKINLSHRKI